MSFLELTEFPKYMQANRSVPKYDAEQEEKTPHPYWDLDRETIRRLVAEISDTVRATLRDFPEDDKELDQLLDAAVRLQQINRSPTVKVALLGAQGAGKSLLINALFDYDGLSLTGADGGACTSSVVKYLFYPSDQQTFFAEVKFLEPKKITAMIKEHAKSYYDYYDNYDNPDEEVGQHKKVLQQEELDLRLKNTAEEFFETLFGSKEDFLENWDSRAYENGEFVSLSLLKYEDALCQTKANENIKSFIGRDQYDLNKQLLPFLSKVKGRVCLWPLVDNVSIRITHPLLEYRIELIDLPGSGDTNASRTRHADEVRDSVDVLIILADTIRITTDESFISRARGAISTHGLDGVKLIATKTDALTENQLAQCTGPVYDEIKQRVSEIENEIELAEEENNGERVSLLSRYKTYLQRYMKCHKIDERSCDISRTMNVKARAWPTGELPEMFQISAASYMEWIKRDRIIFSNQPALSPLQTGIPAIRKFLYHLPAQQNFNDMETHVHVAIPTFIEKLKRAAKHSNRDAGFRNLADEFDLCVRQAGLTKLSEQTKYMFSDQSKASISHFHDDSFAYKAQVNALVQQWLELRGPAFNKILKMGGTVPKGASQAVGLADGCNWNFDLASILAPGFRTWAKNYSEGVTQTCEGTANALIELHKHSILILEKPAANVLVVDKAKNRWRSYQNRFMVKTKTLLDQIRRFEKRTQVWATMETRQENNLIASITDEIYDNIFQSVPPTKEPTTTRKNASSNPRYTMPKIKYKKSKLQKHMTSDENHFVDEVIERFQLHIDNQINKLLDDFFKDIGTLLENYSNWLREQAPINYAITPIGASIRESIEEVIPALEKNSQVLKNYFPDFQKQEADLAQRLTDFFGNVNGKRPDAKGKHGLTPGSKRCIQDADSKAKRIKPEFTS